MASAFCGPPTPPRTTRERSGGGRPWARARAASSATPAAPAPWASRAMALISWSPPGAAWPATPPRRPSRGSGPATRACRSIRLSRGPGAPRSSWPTPTAAWPCSMWSRGRPAGACSATSPPGKPSSAPAATSSFGSPALPRAARPPRSRTVASETPTITSCRWPPRAPGWGRRGCRGASRSRCTRRRRCASLTCRPPSRPCAARGPRLRPSPRSPSPPRTASPAAPRTERWSSSSPYPVSEPAAEKG
jgi:hypothetical protein